MKRFDTVKTLLWVNKERIRKGRPPRLWIPIDKIHPGRRRSLTCPVARALPGSPVVCDMGYSYHGADAGKLDPMPDYVVRYVVKTDHRL